MKRILTLLAITFIAILAEQKSAAQTPDAYSGASIRTQKDTVYVDAATGATVNPDATTGATVNPDDAPAEPQKRGFVDRLSIGGYGEAVASYNMYSDNVYRYLYPANYKDADGHGRFDIPHVVLMIGYDFGRGWSMGMEIEFEHGGTEVAVEQEDEEAGEMEKEVERGGEVAIEQFWIQKTIFPQLNIRAGHMVVPIGLTNAHHLPTEFFTVYRPEGESTIMPCTWHQTGLSIWGVAGKWRYEAMLLPGLNSAYFTNVNWIQGGASSPYEFSPGNKLAGAIRVDNYSVTGLRLAISGYIGNSFNNDIETTTSTKYDGVKGTVYLGAFDFEYNDHNFIARGNFDYGYLSDAASITTKNKNAYSGTQSPYPHTAVGKAAIAAGIEVGYDFFSLSPKLKDHKFYVFARYDYYDSYKPYSGATTYTWTERQIFTAGINYKPMDEIAIKAEYSYRSFVSGYNDEPSISIGVVFSGMFKH